MEVFTFILNVLISLVLITTCVKATQRMFENKSPKITVCSEGTYDKFSTVLVHLAFFIIGVEALFSAVSFLVSII